ncbi:MAG TPA: MFS transporter [Gaiella sp.]|uniref:MFS transporter n=1 Tax=Gaiella sp. TaxID=2663207 RepID=UPI002D7F91B5|nr:MFS transporter [Gaiella sp.]HET9289283.1 MFS transporter [Gaiella sp.]
MGSARLGGRTFASLRHRDYRLYFAGSAVSFIGTWMQQIAAFWLVLDLTHSPVAVGALALVQTLPVTVLSLVGGSLADRVDVRRMLVACDAVLTVVAATLAALALSGAIAVWHFYALGLVYGVVVALGAPSRHTLVFRIVGRDDLPNAVALSSGLGTTARIVGPALGGLVVAAAGPGVAFAVNAGSYIVSIVALLAMRLSRQRLGAAAGPLLAGIAETFRFAFSVRRVTVTFLTVLLVSTFAFNFDVLLPLVARRTLDEGAAVFGLIASVFGAGALCGALILATVGRARLVLVLGGAAGFGAFQLALAPQSSLPVVCALLFVIGIFYILWGSSALAVLQLAAPEHLRGRAASLYFFGFQGGAPVGGLIAGALTSLGGTKLAFTSAGAIAILVAALGAAALVRTAPPRRVEPRSP